MALLVACDPFLTIPEARDNCECIDEFIPDELIEQWIEEASDLIAIATAMRVAGECSVIARPCRDMCPCVCSCCHLDAIPLGSEKPTIDLIVINGDVVPEDEYDLHWGFNGWRLVRFDDMWPSSQNLSKPDTEPGTFAINMTVGVPADASIVNAAALELVCESAINWITGGNPNTLEAGIIQAQIGNTTVQVDTERLARIRAGGGGPALVRLFSLLAPNGIQTPAVWAPELAEGWTLNLRPASLLAS